MLIVTWNVNSLRARMERVLAFLDDHQPDVLCLQETKVAAAQLPHLELAIAGYRALDHSVGPWAGVALLVPDDVEVAALQVGLPGEPASEEARWIEARVRGVTVASVYVPNGREPGHPKFAEKLAFLEAMAERASALAAAGPTVIAGDLNVAPDDRDVWDPAAFVGATHVTAEERDRFQAVLKGGYQDAFRAVEPEAPGFTWWDYRAGAYSRDLGMRIDLALVSHHLEVRRVEVAREYRRRPAPSDHAPLLVHVDVP